MHLCWCISREDTVYSGGAGKMNHESSFTTCNVLPFNSKKCVEPAVLFLTSHFFSLDTKGNFKDHWYSWKTTPYIIITDDHCYPSPHLTIFSFSARRLSAYSLSCWAIISRGGVRVYCNHQGKGQTMSCLYLLSSH